MALSFAGLIKYEPPNFSVPLIVAETDSEYVVVENTRIGLDIVVNEYNKGLSAEEIAYNYDVLQLDQIYSIIAYYVQNEGMVDDYISTLYARTEAAASTASTKYNLVDLRELLEQRRDAR